MKPLKPDHIVLWPPNRSPVELDLGSLDKVIHVSTTVAARSLVQEYRETGDRDAQILADILMAVSVDIGTPNVRAVTSAHAPTLEEVHTVGHNKYFVYYPDQFRAVPTAQVICDIFDYDLVETQHPEMHFMPRMTSGEKANLIEALDDLKPANVLALLEVYALPTPGLNGVPYNTKIMLLIEEVGGTPNETHLDDTLSGDNIRNKPPILKIHILAKCNDHAEYPETYYHRTSCQFRPPKV